ncbi:MAG TPA: hypothetical protein VM689_19965 [Aliidongia sp.]|nr:hypothetical protein [Aliidongia sp.]
MAPRSIPDCRGNAVTNATPAAIAGLDRFGDILLRRGAGAELIFDTLAEAPDCPLGFAYAAALHLLGDTRAGVEEAGRLLTRAERLLRQATPREILFVQALRAIAEDRPHAATERFAALARTAPRDLPAAYIAHLHLLNHGRMAEMLDLARLIHEANPGDGFALGMLSFALDQNDEACAAETAGLAACALDDRMPWAHHALAHAYDSLGRVEEGLRFMELRSPAWEGCGSSMYSHNWWHAMLLRLRLGRQDEVLESYDAHIAPQAPHSTSSFVNAVSLLARLELRGLDVGERWQPLADLAEPRVGEHVLAFLDIHYALALGRAGRIASVRTLARSARRYGAAASPQIQPVWESAGVPLIEAVSSFGLGNISGSLEAFAAAAGNERLVGGSNVQRGLFAELATGARAAFRPAA